MGTPSIGTPSAGNERLHPGRLRYKFSRSPERAPLLPLVHALRSYLGSSRRRVARYLSFPRVTRLSSVSMAPLPTVRHPLVMHHDLQGGWPNRIARSLNGSRTGPVGVGGITTGVQPPRGARKFPANIGGDIAPGLPTVSAAGSAIPRLRSVALRHNTSGKQARTPPVTAPDTRRSTIASDFVSPNRRPDRLFHIALDSAKRETVRAVPSLVPASTHREPGKSASSAPETMRPKIAPEIKLARSEAARALSSTPWPPALTNYSESSPSRPNRGTRPDARDGGQIVGATVHLDGAALGRWAVHHIERALARPSNGMTGVDPRATMPRGHISPF
jgi:hypothetical protein